MKLGLLQPAVALGDAALLQARRHWYVGGLIHPWLARSQQAALRRQQQAAAVHGLRRKSEPNETLFLVESPRTRNLKINDRPPQSNA